MHGWLRHYKSYNMQQAVCRCTSPPTSSKQYLAGKLVRVMTSLGNFNTCGIRIHSTLLWCAGEPVCKRALRILSRQAGQGHDQLRQFQHIQHTHTSPHNTRTLCGVQVYLSANEPHAYLAGELVEVMASSDNVIRAGLTPKFKDCEVLCNTLTYKPGVGCDCFCCFCGT